MNQQGRNAGVSGVVDLPSLSAKFNVRVYAFTEEVNLRGISIAGPNAPNDWDANLNYLPGGKIIMLADVRGDGYPVVKGNKTGVSGTLTLQYAAGKTQTVAISVSDWKVEFCEGKVAGEQSIWKLTLSADIEAEPTWAGWGGTQGEGDVQANQTWQTWEGMVKAWDNYQLLSKSSRRFVVWGVEWSDPVDVAQATAFLAQAVPMIGQKPRIAMVSRLTTKLSVVTVEFGMTTTAQDVTLPRTISNIDPYSITSEATAAALNDMPATPAGDSFVLTSTRVELLNDLNTLYMGSYGLRTSEEGIEFDGSDEQDDPKDLEDEATITDVTTAATPPSVPTAPLGTKHYRTSSKRINRIRWRHVFHYRRRDTEDDVEMPATVTRIDPSLLEGEGTICRVTDTATPTAAPSAPTTDSQHIGTEVVQLHDGKWKHVFRYGPRTSEQDITMQGVAQDDPVDLADSRTIVLVQATETPSAPSIPSGLYLYDTITRQIKPGKWRHEFQYRRRNRKQEIEQDGTYTILDVSDLRSEGKQANVYTTGDPVPAAIIPSGQRLVSTRIATLHDSKLAVHYDYAKDTPKERIEQEHTLTRIDPDGLETSYRVGLLDATPSTPSGAVLRSTQTQLVTHDHTLRVIEAGLRSTVDDVQMPGTTIFACVNDITSRAQISTVYTTAGGEPSAPAIPLPELQLTGTSVQELNRTKSVQRAEYDVTTPKQKVEYGKTTAKTDPTALEDVTTKAEVWPTASLPALPVGGTPSGLVLVDYTDLPLTPTQSVRVWRFGKRTSQDDVEMLSSRSVVDWWTAWSLRSEDTIVEVQDSETPTWPKNYQVGLYPYTVTKRQLNSGKWEHTFHFRRNPPPAEATYPHEYARFTATREGDIQSAELVAWPDFTGSLGIYGQAAFNTLRGQVTFEGLDIRRIDPATILKTVRWRDNFKLVDFKFSGYKRLVRARLNGTKVQVYLAEKLKYASRIWKYRLAEQWMWGSYGVFTIRRRVVSEPLPLYWDYLAPASTNAGVFLGLPIKTVTYTGPDGEFNMGIEFPRVSEVGYTFAYDSGGMFDETDVKMGWTLNSDIDLTALDEESWVDASSLDLDAAPLATKNYEVFA